ncbi:MAG: N,N-dimethylformamidase [Alphaproteobacteria bacterium]|nr:N,N-dimethylformamidase [Alphaproteobacteria bacterium]
MTLPEWLAADAELLVAGSPAPHGADEHFNGKLEAPRLIDHAGAVVAEWDFGEGISTTRIHDRGPLGLHGEAVNLPTRAVTGVRWDGNEMNWTRAPAQYAAIHFHDDDLYDAAWEVDFEWPVPEDWPSALYAIRLAAGEHVEHLPVVVRPSRPGASAPVALLLPTASYMAYANDRCALHGNNPEVIASRVVALAPGDVYLASRPELGLSLYDTHRDGSGVAHSSRLRPVLNMRPGHVAWQGGIGSGLWNFNADTHLTDWLEAIGRNFEVITDEDLERDGQGLLDAYRVVITGTHPEYTSPRMHAAIAGYVEAGGRLMYLGGNGFYWRIAFHRELPGVIEVRRAEDGNRSWAAEVGEYYQSFDGGYGGLWRRNGKPPQQLVGVGYSCQGFNVSIAYRRMPASLDPRVAWMFEGVAVDAPIGDKGLNGGGAAGIECDRADPLLGTPESALVVATASGFPDSYLVTNEDVLVNRPTILGSLNPMIRADMTFFATARGGAVFSTGSIAWAGALSPDGYKNSAARLTGNVLQRFLDEEPFR